MSPVETSPERPVTVHWMVDTIAKWVDRLGTLWIEGELTSWNARGGHVYAKIRDLEQDTSIQLTIWRSTASRLTEKFAEGDRVVAQVKANVWVKGGSLSLNCTDLRHTGVGNLIAQLEALRRKLADEGLFAPERKRRLPFLPQGIGLITGKDSDAEKDVRRNAELRWPAVRFRTIHTRVQGEHTVPEVIEAIARLDADPDIDVIIIARGGGDFLHLLPFSDEALVRAAAAAATPIVSAIGHENDRPILDDVADLRASTPTDAAKRVVPDVAEQLDLVAQLRRRAERRIVEQIVGETRHLDALRTRPVLADPAWIVDQRGEELVRTVMRGDELIRRRVERAEDEVAVLAHRLAALSPEGTLRRGYAIVERTDLPEPTIITATADAPSGAQLSIRLTDGRIEAIVE